LQRLEDSVLPDTNGLHVRDETCDADEPASVKVSARVRDIVTRNLATPDGDWPASSAAEPGTEQLAEENKVLQVRLAFVGSFRSRSKYLCLSLSVMFDAKNNTNRFLGSFWLLFL